MYTEGKDGQKMKKSIVKKVSAICLALTLAFGMTACGGDSKSTESAPAATEAGTTAGAATEAATQAATQAAASGSYTGDKYVNTGKDYTINTPDLPTDYKLVPYDKFTEGFKALVNYTVNTYEETAAVFGDDGIRMDGIVYEGYAYYACYSDKDATMDHKVYVLVTFKKEGDKLSVYGYSSMGIDATDVK